MTLGATPSKADTEEEAAYRAGLAKQCAEIEAKGSTVEIPFELP